MVTTEPMYLISESKIKEIKELIQTISVTGSSVDLDGLDMWFEREIRARGPLPQYPDSTELLVMAHQDWKNREERRGLHGEKDWCAGWITGFLTPTKPVAQQAPAPCPHLKCVCKAECEHQTKDGGCSLQKEHDAAIAAQARVDVLKQIDKALSEKYDKSDHYDCGYHGGLSQVKVWLK